MPHVSWTRLLRNNSDYVPMCTGNFEEYALFKKWDPVPNMSYNLHHTPTCATHKSVQN